MCANLMLAGPLGKLKITVVFGYYSDHSATSVTIVIFWVFLCEGGFYFATCTPHHPSSLPFSIKKHLVFIKKH